MKKVIYPGTFDPPTCGHLSVIMRAARLFDTVVVAVGFDSQKSQPYFSAEERVELFQELTKDFSHVSITSFKGLLVEHAKELGCELIVRSARTGSDYDREAALAYTNKQLEGIETVLLFPEVHDTHIHASLIRDMAKRGRRLKGFVPDQIEARVFERLS